MERLRDITVVLLFAACLSGSVVSAESLSTRLQEGIFAEEIEGDLDAAIKIYEQISTKAESDRRSAANATYRLGMCYLKKGQDAQASAKFEDVTANFAQQTIASANARNELERLGEQQEAERRYRRRRQVATSSLSEISKISSPRIGSVQDRGRMFVGGQPISAGGNSIGEVVPVDLQKDLVLYYSFYGQDDETVTDISGGGNHGQINGADRATDEVLGGVMSFDGEGHYINLPDMELGEFSFASWVQTATDSLNNRRIFLLDDEGEQYYAIQGNGNHGVGVYITGNDEINEYQWEFERDTWVHITVTYDGETVNIYINGQFTESGTSSFSGTINGQAYIGGTAHQDGEFWDGMIDEVALFNRGLTEEEVATLFGATGEMGEIVEQGDEEESGEITWSNLAVKVVSDQPLRQPIAGAEVMLMGTAYGEGREYLKLITDASGSVEYASIQPGEYQLTVGLGIDEDVRLGDVKTISVAVSADQEEEVVLPSLTYLQSLPKATIVPKLVFPEELKDVRFNVGLDFSVVNKNGEEYDFEDLAVFSNGAIYPLHVRDWSDNYSDPYPSDPYSDGDIKSKLSVGWPALTYRLKGLYLYLESERDSNRFNRVEQTELDSVIDFEAQPNTENEWTIELTEEFLVNLEEYVASEENEVEEEPSVPEGSWRTVEVDESGEKPGAQWVVSEGFSADGGYALQLDGDNDCVKIDSGESLDIAGSLTLSAWVQNHGDDNGQIIWRGDTTGGHDPYELHFEGKMEFRIDAGGGENPYHEYKLQSTEAIDDAWHFWSGVYDEQAGKMYLYKDGVLDNEMDTEYGIEYDTSGMWNMIGAVDQGEWQHFRGIIDEVRIWNRARTAGEIAQDMNRSLSGTEAGLVGYWRLNEGEGVLVTDSSGNGNDGKIIEEGGLSSSVISSVISSSSNARSSAEPEEESEHYEGVQTDGQPISGGGNSVGDVVPVNLQKDLVLYYSFYSQDTETVTDISGGGNHGQINGAERASDEILGGVMSFDGSDDYLSMPDVYLDAFTFSAWVKTLQPEEESRSGLYLDSSVLSSNSRESFSSRPEVGINNQRIFLMSDGSSYYALQGNAGGAFGLDFTDHRELNEYNWNFRSNTWTHLTVTYDGTTGAIYKNGVLTEAGSISAEGFTGTFYIGGIETHGGQFWHGMIDEVALFNRALSEEEVGQLFGATGEPAEEIAETVNEENSTEEREVESEHFDGVEAGGRPVRGGGGSLGQVVPVNLQKDVILYYSFSGQDGETVTDISGSGNHGQIIGAERATDEMLGGVMFFDGEDDYISLPDIRLGAFTFSAWVMTKTGNLNNRRMFQLDGGNDTYTVEGNAGRGMSFGCTGGGGGHSEYNWQFKRNVWTHIALTYDNGRVMIYKNGTLTESAEGDFVTEVEGQAYIGGIDAHNGGFWCGMIDEAALFNRALAEEEVEQLFGATGEVIAEAEEASFAVKVDPAERQEELRSLSRDAFKGQVWNALVDWSWSDVPTLLELGESTTVVPLPSNPISSRISGRGCEGMVALWLLEAVRKAQADSSSSGIRYLTLNPVCVRGSREDVSSYELEAYESSPEIHQEVLEAYRKWWENVSDLLAIEAASINPLAGANLQW